MRAGDVPFPQARLAHLVRDIEEMKPVGSSSVFEQRPHPLPGCNCVRRKVKHDRQAGLEERFYVPADGIAQATRVTTVVGHRL